MTLNSCKKGITVIEILIVIVVLSAIFIIVLPQFSIMKENQVLKNTVEDVLSNLDKARSLTLASLNSSSYGVHFQSDRIIIFKGEIFSSEDVNNEEIKVVAPASLSSISLGPGSPTSGDVHFNRLSGTPSSVGTIVVSVPSASKTVTLSASGIASVN